MYVLDRIELFCTYIEVSKIASIRDTNCWSSLEICFHHCVLYLSELGLTLSLKALVSSLFESRPGIVLMGQSHEAFCVNEAADLLIILIKPILIFPLCKTENQR